MFQSGKISYGLRENFLCFHATADRTVDTEDTKCEIERCAIYRATTSIGRGNWCDNFNRNLKSKNLCRIVVVKHGSPGVGAFV